MPDANATVSSGRLVTIAMSALKNLFRPPPIGGQDGDAAQPELEPEPEPDQPRRLNVRRDRDCH